MHPLEKIRQGEMRPINKLASRGVNQQDPFSKGLKKKKKKYTATDYTICPNCQVKILKKNLKKHIRKQHPSIAKKSNYSLNASITNTSTIDK